MTPRPSSTGARAARRAGPAAPPSSTHRRAAAGFVAVALAVLAAACVGSGKTPRTEEIGPLPDGMAVVADSVDGCRDGESGFDYRFLVIGPTEATRTGPLAQHLLGRGFVRAGPIPNDGWSTPDLPWTEMVFQNKAYPLRVEVGRLDRYLQAPAARTGPAVESIPQDVRDTAADYVLVALRPSDFQCSTPL